MIRSPSTKTTELPQQSRSLGYRVMIRLRECEGLPLCLSCLAGDLRVSEQEIAAAAKIPDDVLGFEQAVWWCYACGRKRDVVMAIAPSPPPRQAAA